MQRTALIIDDEEAVRWTIRKRLELDGLQVDEAPTGREAFARLCASPDVVILDHKLPDADGFDVLRRLRSDRPGLPVIMLTAHASVDHAVRAMKSGAFHYACKPFDLDELSVLVERALQDTAARATGAAGRVGGAGVDALIGESAHVRQLRALLRKVGRSPAATVLIRGETGVGKDLAARAIHEESARAGAPFMNITCSAMPTTLLESELFGHEKGAFTGARGRHVGLLERADGGTVFLDEVAETEPEFQAKLLRFVENRTFRRVGGSDEIQPDVRVIAASNVDFAEALRAGRLREDLYHRLAVIEVVIAPLRERADDVQVLADHFVRVFGERFEKTVELTPRARRAIASYPWPGNVRELRNALERAVILSEGETIDADDLSAVAHARAHHVFQLPPDGVDLDELERNLLQQALERTGGNKSQAARLLGLRRDQVRYRVRKHDLDAPDDGDEEGEGA